MEGNTLKAYLLTVAYNGAEYCGWQYQPNQRSVQQTLETALVKVLGKPVRALASSRTDAGVHAIGQAVVIRTDAWSASADRLPLATNIHLPESIVVRQAIGVPLSFHPLRHCISKRYQYRIYNSRKGDPLGGPMQWWVRRKLSIDKMQSAAARLVGTHDFLSFQSVGSPRTSTVRTIHLLTVDAAPHLDGQLLTVTVQANGFLYNMVRNIVGTLVQVGVGREGPEWVTSVLKARNRQLAGAAAPAQGLTLVDIQFDFRASALQQPQHCQPAEDSKCELDQPAFCSSPCVSELPQQCE